MGLGFFFWEVGEVPAGLVGFGGEFLEFADFGGGEEEAAGGVGAFAEGGFELAREEAVFVSVAEDVIDDGFEVFGLGGAGDEVI